MKDWEYSIFQTQIHIQVDVHDSIASHARRAEKINTSKQSCISILNLFGANKELTGKQCEARSQWWVARPWAVSVDESRLGGEGVAFQPACLPP